MTPRDVPVSKSRKLAFAALCVVAVAGAGGYLAMLRLHARPVIAAGVIPTVRVQQARVVSALRQQPYVAFRNLAAGSDYGTLAFAALPDPTVRRYSTNLLCNRVSVGGDVGVCIASEPVHRRDTLGFVLDRRLSVSNLFSLQGAPSRLRVSRDGRRAAYTVFVLRDSYMTSGFSTRSRILDIGSERSPLDLESFDASRDGAPFRAIDFNYWGVTFPADSSQFYATLSSQKRQYLVRGDIPTMRVTVIHEGVECPSVSPDGTRIAFKQKTAPFRWRPAILDLRTNEATVLAETRSIDDQIEWLDNAHVLYAIREQGARPARASIWMAPIDGATAPTLFLADAESPSVSAPVAAAAVK
jgi:WD40 repeat protein